MRQLPELMRNTKPVFIERERGGGETLHTNHTGHVSVAVAGSNLGSPIGCTDLGFFVVSKSH
jgi:hypothetical protein